MLTEPDGENGVSLATEDVEGLSTGMVADFAAIRVPGPADDVHDAEAVFVALGRENVHHKTNAVRFAVDDVFTLGVRRLLRVGRGCD